MKESIHKSYDRHNGRGSQYPVKRHHTPPALHPRRDPSRYRFAIPNAVWEYSLRPPEFLVLSFLCCCRSQTLDANAIARGVHLSTGTVKKYLASLQAKGLVTDDLLPAIQCTDGKNYFTLPNEIFLLTLPPSAILVYAYLLLVEDRRTHQCHSSIRTIAAATHLAVSTVMKSIDTLAEQQFIAVERTTYYDKQGMKWIGNNLYTILPVQAALSQYHRRQLDQLETQTARQRTAAALAKRNAHRRRCEPPCAPR